MVAVPAAFPPGQQSARVNGPSVRVSERAESSTDQGEVEVELLPVLVVVVRQAGPPGAEHEALRQSRGSAGPTASDQSPACAAPPCASCAPSEPATDTPTAHRSDSPSATGRGSRWVSGISHPCGTADGGRRDLGHRARAPSLTVRPTGRRIIPRHLGFLPLV